MRWLLIVWTCTAAWGAPPVLGIDHVAYRVSDAAKSAGYYGGVLGFPRVDVGGATRYQVSADQDVEIEPGLAAGEAQRLSHIAIATSDIRAMLRMFPGAAPRKDSAGNLSFTITAPEGTRIDVVQRAAPAKLIEQPRISTHLQHTGVIVQKEQVDAVDRFYREKFGAEEVWRYSPGGELRLIKLRLPGARRDIIELMIRSGPADRAAMGSAHHINFEVPDIHAAHRFVRAHGAAVGANFRPNVNAEDIWAFNLYDPDGSRTEVQDLTKIPPAAFTEETFHGRRAWVLSNGWMRVALLAGGGHIAEVRLISDDPKRAVNPMRVPHYPTIEPFKYDDARDNPIYGDTPHRWLSSGYMGHLLCFPIYGPPSDEQAKAGVGNHGEAPIVEWRLDDVKIDTDGVSVRYTADLPKTQFRVCRTVTLPRGLRAVHVEEWAENLAAFDRAVMWMQHATFGPPFIEAGKTIFEVSTAGRNEHRVFEPKTAAGGYYPLRADPSRKEQFFTMRHPEYPVTIGYIFPTADNPWIADWQENKRSTVLPWNGQVVARGIEFGTSAYAEGLEKGVARGTFRWIPAKATKRTEFTIFLDEGSVRDAHTEWGVPVLTR